MKQYRLTNTVPVPASRVEGRSRFPLELMKKGDSFLVPMRDIPNPNKPQQVIPYSKARRLGIKIVTQFRSNGLRVWRVK